MGSSGLFSEETVKARLAAVTLGVIVAHAAVGAQMDVEWHFADGQTCVERRDMPERAGRSVFALSRAEIAARGAKEIVLTPSFAIAHKGDPGFWVFSNGEYGTFRCDNGVSECKRWQLMSTYGMQTADRTFAAIVRKLKYYFTTRVTATNGVYRMSCVLSDELARAPYEDFEIEFQTLTGSEATLGGVARAYRRYQLERGACRPLLDRVVSNDTLRTAIDSVEIRIRQAWKPVPPAVLEQSPLCEPPVTPHVTFDRVVDIAKELKRQGVGKAEICLVGWNVGGHDGRWPQMFPAEPVLGGDARLKACIDAVRGLGYLVVPHGNYLDAYRISDSWDEEWLAKNAAGEPCGSSGSWGGGRSYRICAKRSYERFMSREMPRLASLGFRGLGYFDVSSIVPADPCADPRHPLSKAEAAFWWGKSAALAQTCFGGFASEGAFDHFVGYLDYGLYATFEDARSYPKGLVDRMAPFPQMVYQGIFAMNPFTRTINFTAQEKYWQLKLIEFCGRPCFYFYSKFMGDGSNWMGDGDLGCASDEDLRLSVSKIREGADIYSKLSHLQYEFIREHEEISPDVWRTSYDNGESVIVDYNAKTWRFVEKARGL